MAFLTDSLITSFGSYFSQCSDSSLCSNSLNLWVELPLIRTNVLASWTRAHVAVCRDQKKCKSRSLRWGKKSFIRIGAHLENGWAQAPKYPTPRMFTDRGFTEQNPQITTTKVNLTGLEVIFHVPQSVSWGCGQGFVLFQSSGAEMQCRIWCSP